MVNIVTLVGIVYASIGIALTAFVYSMLYKCMKIMENDTDEIAQDFVKFMKDQFGTPIKSICMFIKLAITWPDAFCVIHKLTKNAVE